MELPDIPISLIFHMAIVGYYLAIIVWIQVTLRRLKDKEDIRELILSLRKFAPRFLCYWTLVMQILYFSIALVEDALALIEGQENIKDDVLNCKNYFFAVFFAPMTLLVTIMFYGITCIDRNFLFPQAMATFYPSWVDHSMHALPSIIVFVEMYFWFHKYPSFTPAMLGVSLYILSYYACVILTYYLDGKLLYPFLNNMTRSSYLLLCLAIYVLGVALYWGLYFLNKLIWDE